MIFLKVSSFQKIKLGLLRYLWRNALRLYYLWRNALRLYVYSILFYGGKGTEQKGYAQGGGGIFLSVAGGQVGCEVLLFGLAGSGNPFGFVEDAECRQVHDGGVAAAADNLACALQNSH